MKRSYLYILKCNDGTYYTGVTSFIDKRLREHQSGFYRDSYTYFRRPVELVFLTEFTDINFTFLYEKQIKKWSRAKKESLIKGDYEALPNLAKKKFEK
ncbi:GIY-YIG nuclease family protein [Salegentibacter sediminis]|uniref:GIY-YIG nuclease family protein n=1 Tax=Salegentibacter sediminis TaxID=1930251 RepID=UPI0009BC8A80|nr:GIY-YIG nuclease family protein [Salegentibacter sediminis]